MVRILFVCLIALVIAYKLIGRVAPIAGNNERSSEQLLKQQYDDPDGYPDEPPMMGLLPK